MKNDTTLALSTGKKIDLACSAGTGVSDLVSQNLIINMDEYLDTYGNEMKTVLGGRIAWRIL